jgi:hypothetical protein
MVLVVAICYTYLKRSEDFMEFDNNTPPVNDEQRRLAESKKLTLEPVHTDVAPEDVSDSEIATRHLLEPAVGNVTSDTEQNSTPIQPSKSALDTPSSAPKHAVPTRLVVTVSVALAAACTGAVFFFLS